ncbi:MAG: toxin-activating lysine-acyltransferase [Pseudomonadota bacterium]
MPLPHDQKIQLLGELTHLMLCSPLHRGYAVDDIERKFFPAFERKQFRLWRRKDAMVGLLTWAWLSEEAAARYGALGLLTKEADWTSGEQLWAIDLIAPFGDFPMIASELRRLFPGQRYHRLRPPKPGRALAPRQFQNRAAPNDTALYSPHDRKASPRLKQSSIRQQ